MVDRAAPLSGSAVNGIAIGGDGPLAPHGAAQAQSFLTVLGIALGLALLLCLRVGTVELSGAGLHVDEAQYWDWSRDLQWGYWSKPPGVAALIAASVSLFGDGIVGLRLLGMACWIATAAVLAALAWRMAPPGTSARAAAWTAAVFSGTPASGLLGLVVTTDGPLLLCWSCALAAAWFALTAEQQGRSPWLAWAGVGLAIGLGMLTKYTAAALALSAGPLLWAGRRAATRPGSDGRDFRPWRTPAGMLLATVLVLLLWLPNLAWNARHGWPTIAHTAAITAQAAAASGRGPLASLMEFLAGQLLLIGPAAWLLAWRLRRERITADQNAYRHAEHFALAVALPLLGVGVLQSLNAKAQMNWTAPMLAGLSLWLGLRAGRAALSTTACLGSAAVGVAIATTMALAASVVPDMAGRRSDVWARMRGWDEALAALRPVLTQQQAHAAVPVAAAEREVLVQARRAWRTLPSPSHNVLAWPAEGAPQNHYEQFQPLVTEGSAAAGWPPAVLLLCDREPQAHQRARYARWQSLAVVQTPSGRHLSLWRADEPVVRAERHAQVPAPEVP